MNPIAVFYHCLFMHGDPPELRAPAFSIIQHQFTQLAESGLADAATEMVVGINGPVDESRDYARLAFPKKARMVFHGPRSFAENLTLVELERWLPDHPDWNVLYFHAKGATHPAGSPYGENVSRPWRESMMQDVVLNWRNCISDLDSGYESVGSHFMRGLCDGTQNIWPGNFWWAKSNFLSTLPSIFMRDRIKVSGIASAESRFEAEVWIGNGPRLPHVKEYRPTGGGGVP